MEELVDSTMDLCPLKSLILHLGHVGTPLVLILKVNPPLTRLYPSANEAPDHRWSIKTVPWDQVHQLLDLPIILWSVGPADSLFRRVPDITEGGGIGLFRDVEQPLVPF
jgi:hypothetical protein